MGPIMYWYRIPGSEAGTGYLPVVTENDAMDMLQFVPSRDRVLDVYIVCLSPRMLFVYDWEIDAMDEEVDHSLYFGHFIDDLPLSSLEAEDLDPVGNRADGDAESDEGQRLGEVVGRSGTTNTQTPPSNTDNGPSNTYHGPPRQQRRQPTRRRPTAGINIKEPTDTQGSRPYVQASQSTKDKGKQKVDCGLSNTGKKKAGRPRGKQGCSYAESSDSDDPNWEDFVDSDYELFDEDDELQFQENVDGVPSKEDEFVEMGSDGDISDVASDGSDGFPSYHGSDTDGEDIGPFKVKGKKRFAEWEEFNPKTDMKNPKFKLGMVFADSVVFKKAVRKHAVLTRKELRFVRNERHKVKVICKTSAGCPFWLFASSPGSDTSSLMIKVYRPEHKCSSIEGRVYHCHAPFIADEYMDKFIVDSNWSREGIQNAVNRDFGMDIGYQMCYRAKNRAARMGQGSIEDQYNLLESYAHELKKRNLGTSIWMQTEIDGEITRFKRIYICFEALKQGWRAGCRPIIGLDGCHLKGAYKGQLLSAVGIDGNNAMYPIAYAIVEQETRDSWTWFLTFLREDLHMYSSMHYSFISDKQKGLEQAIRDLFPHSEHRHCVRHLHNNFKGDGHIGLALKQLLWAVARSNTMSQFNKAMENLQNASFNAWKWCIDRPAVHWSRSHFKDQIKCDILLNNHCESFNKSVLQARKKPILPSLKDIRISLMTRLNNRRNSARRWRCKVGPRVEKIMKKNARWSHEYRALESSENRFEIQGRGVACESGVVGQHCVQLDARSCTCRRWDLSGLPCAHAIAAIYSKGWSPDEFVAEWYTQQKYLEAYEVVLNPIAGVAEWERIERPVAPPLYRRQPGRPKTKRTKEPGEEPPLAGTEVLPKSYYSQIKCGRCGNRGHNKRTCLRRSQVVNQEADPEIAEDNVSEEVAVPNVQPQMAEENPPQLNIPENTELPDEGSNYDNAEHVFSQASSVLQSMVNDNQNVNLNMNVNVTVEQGGDDGNTLLPKKNGNVVPPAAQTEPRNERSTAMPGSSGKRFRRIAGRRTPRKSPRLASKSVSASALTVVPGSKPKLQRALWKP
ncbi:uncharacterized protein LOC133728443 [Rosa rugosa]|uniref:uncharacterized protein LOC133728443 n=1 Tax=Rosa rugosa TaxID=74645 RepID=UPI002B411646|nr:uncharacterized protein LOC133728443 [Rosa rugosa]